MTDHKIAKRYARALLSLAQDKDNVSAVHDDLLGLAETIAECAELQSFLRHPTLTRAQQDDGITAMFEARLNALTFSFVKFLAERRRLAVLPAICTAFEDLYCEAHDILRVTVTSAQALTDAQADSIQTKLAMKYGKTIELDKQVDPSLIGGFTVNVQDAIHDSSVKGKIDTMRRVLCHA